MKAIKKIGIGFAVVITLLIIFSVVVVNMAEKKLDDDAETARIENAIVITEPTKSFMEVELKSPTKDPYIIWKCNFSDSTKFSISVISEGAVIGRGADWTENGNFMFSFDEKIINSDSISITCTKHENFHSPNVLKQLKLIDPEVYQIKYCFSMLDLKRKFFQKLFEYKAPQNLDRKTVEVEDWTQEYDYPTKGIWKRKNIKLKSDSKLGKEEISNQLKDLLI
ncbi:hypothetical protein QUH73_13185 [Labilibaculum sp. K2S]|uniref:hypothetical protein n=1 Tax=Labilibaculum sp. K2S TaxID=3056386 RepID=UPI0025A3326C|nr:hypothetical protein [Labilibaculum sp. K2S]MDM8160775.1 hypothetical protein [Labilibaculum sp. K2S]